MQRTGRGSREREREERWLQRRLFSRILTQAAQKRQSDLALWISEENFRSLISFSELRVKLLGYTHTHTHTSLHGWTLLHLTMGDNTSSSICLTFAAWHRRPGGDSCRCRGLNRLSKNSPSPHLRSVHTCAVLNRVVLSFCFKCDYQPHLPVQVAGHCGTRYVCNTRPLTVIERMSNVGLMKPVTGSWTFALTWKSLIGNDTNPNESVSFAEACVTSIQCIPVSLPGNSYIPLTQSHRGWCIRTFWRQVFVRP